MKTLRIVQKVAQYHKEHPEEIIYTNSEDLQKMIISICPDAKVELTKINKRGRKQNG